MDQNKPTEYEWPGTYKAQLQVSNNQGAGSSHDVKALAPGAALVSGLCSRVLLYERIKLEPKYITVSFKEEILNRLKQKVEGICSKHGYIRTNSVELHKVAPGCIEIVALNGGVVYDVHFHADVCNPLVGSVIKSAKVVNMNRFGILAEARIPEDRYAMSVLGIIIAKNSVNITSEIDMESIKIGDEVNVEIVGKKYNLGDKKISVIGRIVKDDVVAPRYNQLVQDNDDEEEEEAAEIIAIDEVEGLEVFEEEEEDAATEIVEKEDDVPEAEGGSEFYSDEEFFDDDDDIDDAENSGDASEPESI